MEEQWGLILSFPDQSSSFALGFEAGQIWRDMEELTGPLVFVINKENYTIVSRMAEYLGWKLEQKDIEYDYIEIVLTKVRPEGIKRNPYGLEVVR